MRCKHKNSLDKLGSGAPGRRGGPGRGGPGGGGPGSGLPGSGGPGAGGAGSPYQVGKPSDIDLEDLAGGSLGDDPFGRKGIDSDFHGCLLVAFNRIKPRRGK